MCLVSIIDQHFNALLELLTFADTWKLNYMMLQYGCAKIVGATKSIQKCISDIVSSTETYVEFVENSFE